MGTNEDSINSVLWCQRQAATVSEKVEINQTKPIFGFGSGRFCGSRKLGLLTEMKHKVNLLVVTRCEGGRGGPSYL